MMFKPEARQDCVSVRICVHDPREGVDLESCCQLSGGAVDENTDKAIARAFEGALLKEEICTCAVREKLLELWADDEWSPHHACIAPETA